MIDSLTSDGTVYRLSSLLTVNCPARSTEMVGDFSALEDLRLQVKQLM